MWSPTPERLEPNSFGACGPVAQFGRLDVDATMQGVQADLHDGIPFETAGYRRALSSRSRHQIVDAGLVVVVDHPDAEGEHECHGDGDNAEPSEQRGSVEAFEDK
jgi:hypothetical protein